jgi:leader peptidase (prepilin peptidase)/N-methyltransferase
VILADIPAWFVRTFALLFGLLFGSFLNVVIHRVPRGESVVTPGSHCACGKPIKPWDNVPVLSWLWLRGRARCCGANIAVRYPLVELLGGLLVLAVVELDVVRQSPDTLFAPLAFHAIGDCGLSLALLAAAFIDLDHMYLPDPITIGGTVFAFAWSALRADVGWAEAAVGMMVGFWGIYLPFIVLYRVIRGRQGMGLGDAKLQALVGAWMGWRAVVFTLFAGAMQGTLAAIVLLLRKGKIEEPEAVRREREEAAAAGEPLDPEEDPIALPPGEGVGGARIAFGPFLILAALEWLLFRGWLMRHVPIFGDDAFP